MVTSDAVSTVISSGEFDGNGAWVHQILHKAWLSCYKEDQEYEDFFCDFLVIWYKRRPKYDPTRASLTTFIHMTATSYIRCKLRSKRRRSSTRRHDDCEVDVAVYDEPQDQSPLVVVYAKSRKRSVASLAVAAGMTEQQCRDELADMAEAVKRHNTRVVSVRGYFC